MGGTRPTSTASILTIPEEVKACVNTSERVQAKRGRTGTGNTNCRTYPFQRFWRYPFPPVHLLGY